MFLNSRERVGLFFILCIAAVFLIVKYYFVTSALNNTVDVDYSILNIKNEKSNKFSLFNFNPNTTSSDSILMLNMPYWVKKNIIKYREAGGVFEQKSDIRRIYGMNDSIYRFIESFIVISPVKVKKKTAKKKKKQVRKHYESKIKSYEEPVFVELNRAELEDLMKLKGIGKYRAQKIINFRTSLGGFHNPLQLYQVYGMPDSIVTAILPMLSADSNAIDRIDINKASLKELALHPYISKQIAQRIINYRKIAVSIKRQEELVENNIIDERDYDKIKNYLYVH